MDPETGTSNETVRDRLRMLAAVDDGVGLLFAALTETKQLDNTVIDQFALSIDLAPTLIELANCKATSRMDGYRFWPASLRRTGALRFW